MAVDIRDPEQLPGVSRATGVDLAETMQDLYARTEMQLARRIAQNLKAGIETPSWALEKLLAVGQLNDWAKILMRRLGSDVSDEIRYSMLSAYLQGGTEATRALAEASDTLPEWINKAGIRPGERIQELLDGRRSRLAGGIADLARQVPGLAALQRMIGSLALRVTGTHLPVLRWVDDAYRRVIAETALTPVILGTTVRRAASQRAWEQLLTEGVNGFTDKAGRNWSLASYVEMATRTGVAQAAVEGHLDRLTDAGIDLVIVSNAPQECKRCRPWEGKVLARSGPDGSRTITVEHAISGEQIEIEIAGTVDEAVRAGLMHPNCRHSLSAYLPGVTRIPTGTEDPEGDEARQKLRALERQIRKEKLAQAAVIDPAAQPRLDAAVKATQARIRQHVKDTEHLGIMRKREREQPDLGNSSGLNAGKQAPKPPAPKPAKPAKATPAAADDELTTITEVPTSESPAAKKYAAEKAAKAAAAKPKPMEVPEFAKPYHLNVDGVEDIARQVEANRFSAQTPLTGGVSAETSLVTLPDGSKLVRKSAGNPTAEHAASMLGRAIGVDVPRVYRNHPSEVWMEYVADGKTWAQLRDAGPDRAREALASDDGRLIGLFDLMINNGDRNDGNWMIRDNGRVVAIDHGHAFNVPAFGRLRPDIGRRGPFTEQWLSDGKLGPNSLTPADVAEIRRRLTALEPDFAHIEQPRWLQYALVVLDAVEQHATGTRNLVAGVR